MPYATVPITLGRYR